MKALDLSRTFFKQTALPALQRDFPEAVLRIAAGLVGNGSECFGFDDEFSKDHDWGIDFYIWILEKDRNSLLEPLSAWKEEILRGISSELCRAKSDYGSKASVMSIGDFYGSLIGVPQCPETLNEWHLPPEENFAMAVNGEVFYDPIGDFSTIRKALLAYYPEDLRLKRMASACMLIAQTGQYNFTRTVKRKDWVTVNHIRSAFSDHVSSLVFLLNRVYKPYYKWSWRKMQELPVLGSEIAENLRTLALSYDFTEESLQSQHKLIGVICSRLSEELLRQGLSDSKDWFLTSQGEQIQHNIKDDFLRMMPPQFNY